MPSAIVPFPATAAAVVTGAAGGIGGTFFAAFIAIPELGVALSYGLAAGVAVLGAAVIGVPPGLLGGIYLLILLRKSPMGGHS